ncbi:MAG: UDP-N-acetylmuramoyl-tripeptide--D-alanyl-D-alanine ligase [Lachnospiraceae bacterium]|nr:UDP-N-acetylmuramoyl-tripeptide--D-alanyl-D-alanine ligase [Lachnospiraceae bacterium]
MKNMTLANITKACNGTYCGDKALLNEEISGVEKDSRLIEKGMLYLPFVGNVVDGHDFIPQVFEKGALCTLSEKELDNPAGPYILVDSVNVALKDIAEYYRSTLSTKIIGITGSVGKTSTKEIIASVLSEKFNVLKTEGNYNNEIGMPLTILRIREEHQVGVIEMGISDFGEMHRLSKVSRPDIAVITNIGTCHLEKLGDRDGVFKAKTEMFEYVSKDGAVILNGNDDKLIEVEKVGDITPQFFGVDGDFDCKAVSYESLGLTGTSITIDYKGETFDSVIPVPGHHMVYNALAATCVGRTLGMSFEEIDRGIRKLKTIGGRNNIIETEKYIIIDDCYNANPVSMRASIDVLGLAKGRKVAILGDMFELGENEIHLHKEVGEYAGKSKIDKLICIGSLAENYAEGAYEAGGNMEIVHYNTKEDFLDAIDEEILEHDNILIKASNGMKFKELVEYFKDK